MEEMESIDSNSDIELMDEDPDPVNISIKRKHPIHRYFVYSSESQTRRLCVWTMYDQNKKWVLAS